MGHPSEPELRITALLETMSGEVTTGVSHYVPKEEKSANNLLHLIKCKQQKDEYVVTTALSKMIFPSNHFSLPYLSQGTKSYHHVVYNRVY